MILLGVVGSTKTSGAAPRTKETEPEEPEGLPPLPPLPPLALRPGVRPHGSTSAGEQEFWHAAAEEFLDKAGKEENPDTKAWSTS